MKEYIEREWLVNEALAVLDFRKQHYTDKNRIADAEATVEWLKYYAPAADVVEVVRCKDCKYIRPIVNEYTHDVTGLWCSLFDIENVAENHFCSYGERRG